MTTLTRLSHTLMIALALSCGTQALAAQVALRWNAPNENSNHTALEDLTGFRVYHGLASGAYTDSQDVGNVTNAILDQLEDETTHYIAVTAYDSEGTESALSDEFVWLATAQSTPAQATQTADRYRAGDTLTVQAQFETTGTDPLFSLLWRPALPAGWVLSTASGDGAPEVNGGEIVFGSQFAANPVVFQYTVSVPSQASGVQTLSAAAEYMLAGMANPATVSAEPLNLTLNPIYQLVVVSSQEGVLPPVGISYHLSDTLIAAAVTGSPVSGATGVRTLCTGWSGTGSVPSTGAATNLLFTLTSDSTLTWNWITQYQLTAAAGLGGQVSPTAGWFADGTAGVAVEAVADPDYSFAGWSGDVPSGQELDNPLLVTMDAPRSLTATFTRNERALTVVSAHGGAAPAAGTQTYPYATPIAAAVTNSPVASATGVRYLCTGWSGTGSVPSTGTATNLLFTLTSDSTLTWNWITQYQLTAAAGLGGQVSPTAGWFADGTAGVAVEAVADPDYSFAGWSGDVPSGQELDNPLLVTMDAPRSLTATFTRLERALTVVSAHGGAAPAAGTQTYPYATPIAAAVTNSPVAGATGVRYLCTGWSGTGSVPSTGAATNLLFTLTSDSTLTWNWITQYQLTAAATVGGQVSPTAGWFAAGTAGVAVEAIADPDYGFAGWSGDVPSGQELDNPLLVTMDAPRSLTATFSRLERALTVVSAHGGAAPAAGTQTYPYATAIAAAVTNSPVAGATGVRYLCTGWSGTGSVPSTGAATNLLFTLTSDSTLTWNWITQYQLTVDTTVGGQAVASADWVESGLTATATATAISGFAFSGWSGDVPAGHELDNPLTLTLDAPRSVSAQFVVNGNAIRAEHTSQGHYRSPSSDTEISATFTYPADATLASLRWNPTLPAGWALVSASGSDTPSISGTSIVFPTPPTANPVTFQFTVSVPGNDTTTHSVGGAAEFQLQGMTSSVSIPALPDALTLVRLHVADYVDAQWQLDATELGRVLAYWRAGGYENNPEGYDGFSQTATPDVGNTNDLHTADFREPYRIIDGTEVSRVLAYWRAGGYQLNAEGADGYAPLASAPATFALASLPMLDALGDDTAVMIQSASPDYQPGARLSVTNTMFFPASLLSLSCQLQIPDGWTLVSVTGDGKPERVRNEVVWTGALPPSPIQWVYTIEVPIEAIGEQHIGSVVEYQPTTTANPLKTSPTPDMLAVQPTDTDGDGLADGWEAYYGSSGDLLSDADDDADGMANGAEYLAGTAPNDPRSVLALQGPVRGSDAHISITWQSAPGRSYTLEKATALDQTFVALQQGIVATPPLNTCRDPEAATGKGFYRILLEP